MGAAVPSGWLADAYGVADKSAEFSIDSLQRELRRILASIDSDPDDVITAAKSLVEAACRAILSDFGEQPANGVLRWSDLMRS